MLFKIAEREELRNRNAELESQAARIPILERLNAEQAARIAELEVQEVRLQIQILARRIAYLEARDVENTARIAELEKQKAQQNEKERR